MKLIFKIALLLSFISVVNISCVCDSFLREIDHAQGEIAGEPTQTSIILQSRLTCGKKLIQGDVQGARGWGCFELSDSPGFSDSFKTRWVEAVAENDFIIKQKINNLRCGTRYYYRFLYGPNVNRIKTGNICTFSTLDCLDAKSKVAFVVVTGMNYYQFHHGARAYEGPDKKLGYPALETILDKKPDFFVGTGDNVYLDHPIETAAQTQEQLRKKYHEQFVQSRYKELFAQVPTYWEKDDHDFRYDDSDNTTDRLPSPELGIRTFIEQLPVVDVSESKPLTYRTHRINKLLQIWLVEGRDYRSPNKMPDGPGKTIWGQQQKQWLKKTLLESDAVFKILISPTPMVGPDKGTKRDNHTNPKGFRYEADEFFRWLEANGFLKRNFYIVCGDRHWQYHSVHPSGFEEFSCGALVDGNSRIGIKPGDPTSTDPKGLVNQIYTQKEASGGFLLITVEPGNEAQKPGICFAFYDENGIPLYQCTKTADDMMGI